jgi:hypothetical protein
MSNAGELSISLMSAISIDEPTDELRSGSYS